jgi:RecB family exonuclease
VTRDRQHLVAAVGGDTSARPIAVTAIERAAGCAFAGFARRVLRVRRAEDLAEAADARDRGTLVHRALHAAFEGARGATARADAIALARTAAERELGLGTALAPLRREAVVAAVADAVAAVERSFEPGEALRFFAAEQRFGPVFVAPAAPSRRAPVASGTLVTATHEPRTAAAGAWPAFAIAGEEGDGAIVYVDGQIDRIDATADHRRARVVDYKTGKLPTAAEHGKRVFQLPLYAAVAARALGSEEVEAVYVALRMRGAVQEWPRDDDDRRVLGARREEIAQAARRVVLAMWDGDAAPRPFAATLCTRCEARDVCRRPAVAPIEEADDR